MKKLVFLVVLLVFVGSACAADITSGLVGWWKMDGQTDPGNAQLVKDYSGFGNDGTMGSADTWLSGGGIDFSGSANEGASSIVFANGGADLIADMGLTSQVTVSFIMSGHTPGVDSGYVFSGTNSDSKHIMSMEAPTGDKKHFLTKMGTGTTNWMWEVFNAEHASYIFKDTDAIRITVTVDFATGIQVYYLGDHEAFKTWGSFGGAAGSFTGLTAFKIGAAGQWSEYDSNMEDFRIYNRALSAEDVAALPEPATIALLGLGGLVALRKRK